MKDLVLALALAIASASGTSLIASRFDPRFLREPSGNDVWFEADLPIVTDRVQHRWSDQSRNARHPLFPLFATLPVNALKAVGVGADPALRAMIAAFAALWTATLYLLLLGITRRQPDALIFTALAHASAAAIFWLPVPETYTLGSASVMAALALCAWDTAGRSGAAAYVAVAAFSLSVTTTNWLTGLSAIVARHPWRQALQLAANSLTAVVLVWGLQRLLFSTADFFIGAGAQTRFILPHGAAGIGDALRAVLFHSIVMPAIAIVPEPKWGNIMSVQDSSLFSGGAIGTIALLLWTGLLAAGIRAMAVERSAVRLPLALALGGHLVVYCLYGEETFLYTLHAAPLLVAVAALATRTRLRPLTLGVAALLTVALAVRNTAALREALRFFDAGWR
jgi:hypothetical protein